MSSSSPFPFSIRDRGQPALVAELLARIAAHGPMTFAEFMATALYHRRYGYYMVGQPVGYAGDFYTSPEVHPAFGYLLACQLAELWERLGEPPTFTVVEVGGGTGALADAILARAAELPGFGAALRYTIVETSPTLQARQAARLDRWTAARPGHPTVSWAAPTDGAVPVRGVVGCILANELLDALPVHRVTVQNGQLREIVVDADAGAFVERIVEPTTPRLAAYFADLGLLPAEGAVAEVNLAMLDWIASAAAALARGWLIVIDYGAPAAELFAPDRRHGTLHGTFQHTRSTNPYRRIGLQDLTALVDLTSLANQAVRCGLVEIGRIRQAAFLRNLGLAEYAAAIASRELPADELTRNRRALAELARPDGLGSFWVVCFGRDVASTPLAGFCAENAIRSSIGTRPLPLLPSAFESDFPELAALWRETFSG